MNSDTQSADTRPRLETHHLVLRPFSIEDEEAVFRNCSNKEIARNTRSIPHPYPREQAAHWIKQHPEMWVMGKAAVFAICLSTDQKLVGAIGLEINQKDHNAELGYWIDQDHWGQGICSEAAEAVVRFGFEELALHKIHAHFLTTNPASGRVMEKIGMRKEGLFLGHIRKWGQFQDVCFYGILRKEFEIAQQKLLSS